MHRLRDTQLTPLDPEIERTFRERLREQQGVENLEIMAENQGANPNMELNNAAPVVDERDRIMMEYAVPVLGGLNPCIVRPEIQANQFELKPVMFQMLQTMGQFSGMPTEDPHLHLKLFMEVCDSFKWNGVTEEAIRLKLFPYS